MPFRPPPGSSPARPCFPSLSASPALPAYPTPFVSPSFLASSDLLASRPAPHLTIRQLCPASPAPSPAQPICALPYAISAFPTLPPALQAQAVLSYPPAHLTKARPYASSSLPALPPAQPALPLLASSPARPFPPYRQLNPSTLAQSSARQLPALHPASSPPLLYSPPQLSRPALSLAPAHPLLAHLPASSAFPPCPTRQPFSPLPGLSSALLRSAVPFSPPSQLS